MDINTNLTNYPVFFRDSCNKNKKLAWVMKNLEKPFCTEFKEKYASYKNLAAVHEAAIDIYSKHCEDYNAKKVRVWDKAHKRQASSSTFPESHSTDDDAVAAQNLHNAAIRELFDNNAKEMMEDFENMVKITQPGINHIFSAPTKDLEFAKYINLFN